MCEGCDSTGADLGGYRYTAFGNAFAADATTPAATIDRPLRWKGRPFVNVAGGLYDMRARWWSPQMGAFLAIDRYAYQDPRSTLWGWPGQNPIRWADPTGHDAAGTAIGASIGGGIGGSIGGGLGAAGGFVVGIPTEPGEVATIPAGAIGGFGAGAGFGALVGGAIGDLIGDWINLQASGEQGQLARWARLTGATKEQVGNAIEAIKEALGLGPKQNVDDVQPNGDVIKDGEVIAIDVKTNATLRILADDLDPDSVSSEMGMESDRSHKKGDVAGVRAPVVKKGGYWSIRSSKHLAPSADTNDHIQWLVAAVAPRLGVLDAYKGRGWTVDVWIGIHTSVGHGGPTLRPDVLARLASLGLDVNLDLYPDA